MPGHSVPPEQMGRILQRTAISTNIKERLDFSCALFGPDGGLVSNAPHIPVHLGAMQETVQFQVWRVPCLLLLPRELGGAPWRAHRSGRGGGCASGLRHPPPPPQGTGPCAVSS